MPQMSPDFVPKGKLSLNADPNWRVNLFLFPKLLYVFTIKKMSHIKKDTKVYLSCSNSPLKYHIIYSDTSSYFVVNWN